MDTLMVANAVKTVLILALVVVAVACITGLRQASRQARAGLAWWYTTAKALRVSMLGRGDPILDVVRTIAMQGGEYPAVAAAREKDRSRGAAVVLPAMDAAWQPVQ